MFRKQQQVASLDKIAAEENERRRRWKKAQLEELENNATPPPSSSNSHSEFGTSSNSIPVNLEASNFIPNAAKLGEKSGSSGEPGGREDADLLSFGEESDDVDDYGDEKVAVGGKENNHTLPFVTGTLVDPSLR